MTAKEAARPVVRMSVRAVVEYTLHESDLSPAAGAARRMHEGAAAHRARQSGAAAQDAAYRAEVSLSGEYEGDWVAALVEFNLAPHWSIYASDMYNIGRDGLGTKKNYYNAGFSYTYNRTRIQLSYGRNRAGYICSGGVCRYQPEYTGFNLAITSSF